LSAITITANGAPPPPRAASPQPVFLADGDRLEIVRIVAGG
jgi:sulfur carrier protein ThiS